MPVLKRYQWHRWAEAALEAFLNDAPSLLALDTETEGVGWYDPPFAATIAWRSGSGVQSYYFELQDSGAYKALAEILSYPSTLIFHNSKFDLQKLFLAELLRREDVASTDFHDTECLMHLIDEHQKKDLKTLAVDILNIDGTLEIPYKSGPRKGQMKRVEKESHKLAIVRRKLKLKKEDGYHRLPRENIVPYALKDAEHTLLLFESLYPRLENRDLYEKEMELVLVVLDMETAGLGVDVPYLKKVTRSTNTSLLKAEKALERLTGLTVWYPSKPSQKTPEGHINPNSHDQLIVALNERGVEVEGTANELLKPIDDELVEAILELREQKKLRDYLYAIDRERLGTLIHAIFKLFKPITGRMASGKQEEN